MDALDTYIPDSEARRRQAVPDVHRRRVLDQGPRHGRHRPYRTRQGQGRRRSRDHRPDEGRRRRPSSPASRCSTRRSIRASPATTSACCCAASKRDGIERGQVLAKPGSITPHTKFEANVYVLTQGRRRPAHAVLRRLSAAVLLPHHRRHRLGHGTDRRRRQQGGNVHARRQHQGHGRTAARHARSPWTKTSASPSAKAAAPSAPAS